MTALPSPAGPRLAVVLDLRHPFSYLALGPTFDLVAETGVETEWLPLRGRSLARHPAPTPADDRGVRHRRFRGEMIAREIAVYAGAQGLRIESPYRDGGADAFHLAWLWVLEQAPGRLRAFLEEVFRSYWALALDPERIEDLLPVLGDLELDAARFREWAGTRGPEALAAAAARVSELGIPQAPGYRVGDEVFLGRQHLPMIRWLLRGRAGDRPI